MALAGQTVLITGGTGSFGNTMAKRLLGSGVAKVKIFSRDETKQHQMRIDWADERLEFHIGDVRSRRSLQPVMKDVDHVFHAAALKQVPSGEFFPVEAVRTNVMGSANVLEAAVDAGVRGVVCLSTDKAVLPANAMGMTKGLMEKVAIASARSARNSDTTISSVRFGNVMYSRGSVIPLFVQQIFAGRPLTVIDPEMTRFLLALESAVDLVSFAMEHASAGDIFVRKAPAATVETLAKALLMIFEADNPLENIGVRHGEKLYETLATSGELRNSVDEGDYWRVQMDGRGLDYDRYYVEGDDVSLEASDDYHSHNTTRLDVAETAALLSTLPEIGADLERWAHRSHQ